MNNYETVFILTPVLSDAQMKEAVDKFKNILTEQGAEIVNEENWGLRKLAYPIEKKTTGFYYFLEFKADPSVIEKLEINYRRDERVIASQHESDGRLPEAARPCRLAVTLRNSLRRSDE